MRPARARAAHRRPATRCGCRGRAATAWCWRDERDRQAGGARPPVGCVAALGLDAAVLRAAVRADRRGQPVDLGPVGAAVHLAAAARVRRLAFRPRPVELRAARRRGGDDRRARRRASVPARLRQFAAAGRVDDAGLPARGLPLRLPHRAFGRRPAQHLADARDAAVLDLVPAARLRLDAAAGFERGGVDQPAAAAAASGRPAAAAAVHPRRGAGRDDLQLPAVHGAAAVRQSGEARPAPDRGRARPRRQPVDHLRRGDAAAVGARHRRRGHAGVHPGGGRIRDPRPARRRRRDDDRPQDLGRLRAEPGLADGVGGRGGDGRDAGRAHRAAVPGAARAGARAVNAAGRGWGAAAWLLTVYTFLYLPIVCLMVFSFTAGEITTQFAGFSLRWYRDLFADDELGSAVLLSLRVGSLAATAAVVVGTVVAVVLVRWPRQRGNGVLAGMTTAPMVLPEVVIGLSLVLLFTHPWLPWLGGRGVAAIWVAHTTLCTAYVSVVVQSRLAEMDRALEEAALDLGCPPAKVFLVVTVPVIAPALAAGWLLAFTLSMDDFVLSAMLSDPGSTTLPVLVFARLHHGLKPEINALATVIVVVVSAAVAVAPRVDAPARRRRLAARVTAAS